ncbi:serine/threonine-protein kinase [Loktanella sp. M215]|uniref:serine/threonine-protein kinase n=1 Tax=Loktanella sp. M215 TaxID=2675431 RepID=UPI001F0034A9|nr:serine/threonine-protein kinase [Loktanella sp. M215]MCF7699908.1 protein kinase [Loktanella sp. M215]
MTGTPNRGIFNVGDVLNNTYRIDKVLGRGGTSEVYRAVSEISGRVVALKALRLEYSRNEDFLALMTREEEMREIRHDAVVRYYDNQRTDQGLVYLVMDYVEGPGLDQKIKQGGMPAADLMVVARRVTQGLIAAHAKNIVHRDLSPDNIILRHGNPADAVIIDFGIAKDTNPGAETIVGNEFAGKYAYAAPEQLGGQTDARVDIYALGALLLAAFEGKAPDIGSNPMEVIQRKAQPLDTGRVPEPLKSLIDKMTHPDRDARLQTAQDVLQEIDHPTVSAVDAAPLDFGDDAGEHTVIAPRPAAAKTPPTVAPQAAVPAKPKGRGGLIGVAAVVVVLAVGGGLYGAGVLGGSGSVAPADAVSRGDAAPSGDSGTALADAGTVTDPAPPPDTATDVAPVSPALPVADPYTFAAARPAGGSVEIVGNVPSQDVRDAVQALTDDLGGTADLTLASGDIAANWGTGIVDVLGQVSVLPDWSMLADGNALRISGTTDDPAERDRLMAALAPDALPAGLTGTAEISLTLSILQPPALEQVLQDQSDCGALHLVDPPAVGYAADTPVQVAGEVASDDALSTLTAALTARAGTRPLDLNVTVLNPALCQIAAVLPAAPPGGIQITFGNGANDTENPTGTFVVGDNPVIDVTIPATMTTGYLFVSALDVSGNVFHLLPNMLTPDNAVTSLRQGGDGPVTLRVAWPLAAAADGKKLAFTVDDTTLGKTQILAIHAEDQIFDGLRPTTESAAGYATALAASSGTVRSLDSAILTTAAR